MAARRYKENIPAYPVEINYMKENKIHWSQVELAFHAYKAENLEEVQAKVQQKNDARSLMGNKKSIPTSGDVEWIRKDGVQETAWEAAQRLGLKIT